MKRAMSTGVDADDAAEHDVAAGTERERVESWKHTQQARKTYINISVCTNNTAQGLQVCRWDEG